MNQTETPAPTVRCPHPRIKGDMSGWHCEACGVMVSAELVDERLRHAEDWGEVEEFVTHLYPYSGQPNSSFTFCGLHVSQDAHAQMHRGYEQKSPRWSWAEGGPGSCPSCGAPLCPVCEQRA